MATINLRDIPDELHHSFKVLCVSRRTTMRDALIAYMGEQIARADLAASPQVAKVKRLLSAGRVKP